MKLFNRANNNRYIPSVRVMELERENRLLRKELEEKKEQINFLDKEIRDLKLLIAELQKLLFHGKKSSKDKKNDKNDKHNDANGSTDKKPRSQDSYRRSVPQDKEITKEEEYTLNKCLYCGGDLKKINERLIYLEDMVLNRQKKS